MAILGLVLVAIAFLSPVAALLSRADFSVLSDLVSRSNFSSIMISTLVSSMGGAIISVVSGLFFARVFALHDWRGKRFHRLVYVLPFLVPNFVLATAYVVAWNPVTGLLNSAMKFPFGLYGLWGMTFLFGVVHAPVVFLMLEEKIGRIDASLREAARLSGAGPLQVFQRIELPLLFPGLLASTSICFVLNIATFAIPAWIGAPERSYTLSYKVYQSIQIGGLDGFPQAASYALILVSLVLPTLVLLSVIQRGDQKYRTVSGKGTRRSHESFSRASFLGFQLIFWFTQIFTWVAPLGSLFASTLVAPGCLQSNGIGCLAEPSLKAYRYVLFELPDTALAFKGSFLYGGIASLLISVSCIFLLVLFSRSRGQMRVLEWIVVLASSTPGAVLALGLIVVLSGRFYLNLYNTAWIVVAAFVIKHLSLAFQPLRTGLASISVALQEAAKMSGAGAWAIWTRITFPILKPELVGGFFLVFVPIVGELTMSVFLVSPNFQSIGTLLFDLQDYADQGSAAALSIVLVGSVLVLNEAAMRFSGGRIGY